MLKKKNHMWKSYLLRNWFTWEYSELKLKIYHHICLNFTPTRVLILKLMRLFHKKMTYCYLFQGCYFTVYCSFEMFSSTTTSRQLKKQLQTSISLREWTPVLNITSVILIYSKPLWFQPNYEHFTLCS